MPPGRTLLSTILVTGLILGTASCSGDDQTTSSAPVSNTPPSTPSPIPTTVDPVAAAKAKVITDYELFINFRSQGWISNKPSFPYEEVMTGKALTSMKAVVTGAGQAGTKYSGTVQFVKGSVVAIDIEATPATATVKACVHDALVAKTKTGKTVSAPPAYVAREDRMTLVAGRWKASETKSTGEDSKGCPA